MLCNYININWIYVSYFFTKSYMFGVCKTRFIVTILTSCQTYNLVMINVKPLTWSLYLHLTKQESGHTTWQMPQSTDKVWTDGRTNGQTKERTNVRTDSSIWLCPQFYLGAYLYFCFRTCTEHRKHAYLLSYSIHVIG